MARFSKPQTPTEPQPDLGRCRCGRGALIPFEEDVRDDSAINARHTEELAALAWLGGRAAVLHERHRQEFVEHVKEHKGREKATVLICSFCGQEES